MTIQEFFNKYNYKPINWDNALGFQCMDLYHQYVQEVLPGYPHPSAKGAAWLIGALPESHYKWINNGLFDVPQLGDILLWGTKAGGGYGHVAVYKEGNVLNFTSFDQNWPVGSYCHFQSHNYFGDLKGWYRPKPTKNWDVVVDRMKTALNTGGNSESRAKEADKIFHS
jgi:hypothetical protein